MQFHHISGSCSAQPVCGQEIVFSVSGNCAEAINLPVEPSTTDALMEDVPKSKPKSSIGFSLKIGIQFTKV